jgi:hypothetical protein
MEAIRHISSETLADIQRIEAAEFEPYISRVGPIFERLQQLKGMDDEQRVKGSDLESYVCGDESCEAEMQLPWAQKSSMVHATLATKSAAQLNYN